MGGLFPVLPIVKNHLVLFGHNVKVALFGWLGFFFFLSNHCLFV